jgi:protocatechuate 3,4-dioxygenase beta subunit
MNSCMNTPFFAIFFAVSAIAADDTKFTPPPGEESAEIRALIDRAQSTLAGRGTTSDILADAAYMPAHAYPRFRDLIRASATAKPITLVPPTEPGTKLLVHGTVKDSAGTPIAGALVYAYHTSAKGWYSDKAAHISGNSGDTKHARLFGYVKTDSEGRFELRTIRPAGYPETDLPAHIHVHVDAPGSPPRGTVTEIRFDDDPRLTIAWRERSKREGDVVCQVKKETDGGQSVTAELVVR